MAEINIAPYSWIYYVLRRNGYQKFIEINNLKAIISRIMVKKGGFPRKIDEEVIKDMAKLQLIKRINQRTYQILESKCCKRINNLIEIYY